METKLTLRLAVLELCLVLVSCSPIPKDIERFEGPPNVKKLLSQLDLFRTTNRDLKREGLTMGIFAFGIRGRQMIQQRDRAEAVINHLLSLKYEHPKENLATLHADEWLNYVKGPQVIEDVLSLAHKWDDGQRTGTKMAIYKAIFSALPNEDEEKIESDIEKMDL